MPDRNAPLLLPGPAGALQQGLQISRARALLRADVEAQAAVAVEDSLHHNARHILAPDNGRRYLSRKDRKGGAQGHALCMGGGRLLLRLQAASCPLKAVSQPLYPLLGEDFRREQTQTQHKCLRQGERLLGLRSPQQWAPCEWCSRFKPLTGPMLFMSYTTYAE